MRRRPGQDPLAACEGLKLPAAVLIGPEGGFTAEEREMLKAAAMRDRDLARPAHHAGRYGRHVAALALVQATLGDWHQER